MTRAVSAALATHIGGISTTLATCVKVKRKDGTKLGFTDAVADLNFDLGDGDGALTYKAATAYARSDIENAAGLNVDNLELDWILDSTAITAADLRAGRYDFAAITMFLVNRADLTQGSIRLRTGWLGEVSLRDNDFRAELRGMAQALAQGIIEVYTPDCLADLGDTRCKVRVKPPAWAATTAYTKREAADANTGSVVKPTTQNGRHYKCTTAGTSGASEPTWNTTVGGTTADSTVTWTTIQALSQTGTVATVTDKRQFTATGVSLGADHLLGGLVEWLTGANAGLKAEIKSDSGAGALTLYLPMPFAIAVSDTFTAVAGCRKRLSADCVTKFDNAENFRGFPFVPGTDVALDYPDAR